MRTTLVFVHERGARSSWRHLARNKEPSHLGIGDEARRRADGLPCPVGAGGGNSEDRAARRTSAKYGAPVIGEVAPSSWTVAWTSPKARCAR